MAPRIGDETLGDAEPNAEIAQISRRPHHHGVRFGIELDGDRRFFRQLPGYGLLGAVRARRDAGGWARAVSRARRIAGLTLR